MDITANNLANINTTAFKSSRPAFGDLLYRALQHDIVPQLEGAREDRVGGGSALRETRPVFGPGNLMPTGRSLDVAIAGAGFFAVQDDAGRTLLTRDGCFRIDGEGRLVTPSGHPLAPEIKLPADGRECRIAADGTVTVTNAQGESEEIGRIKLYNVPNPAGLEARGHNLYMPNEVSGAPQELENVVLRSGYLESANTSMALEMTELIEAHRAYQVNIRMAQTTDNLWELAHRIKE